jgi:hypothetical protein
MVTLALFVCSKDKEIMDMKLLQLLVVENCDQRLETKCCLSIDLVELEHMMK